MTRPSRTTPRSVAWGAAFVHSGPLTLITCDIYRLAHARMGGTAVACLFLVIGFALFGKNLLNVWPGIGGTHLYAPHQCEPFSRLTILHIDHGRTP